jgi:hypothetical protein
VISRRTQLLALAVLLSAGNAVFSYLRMDGQRDGALAAERDYQIVHRDLADLMAAGGGGQRVVPGRFDPQEVSRRLNTAAAVAGIPDKLKDVDPKNPPVRLGNTDYSEQPVILRFEGITLQQLTRYLHELATSDPGSRAKSVELSPPETAPASGSGELWTADVSIAYLTYAPKETRSGR